MRDSSVRRRPSCTTWRRPSTTPTPRFCAPAAAEALPEGSDSPPQDAKRRHDGSAWRSRRAPSRRRDRRRAHGGRRLDAEFAAVLRAQSASQRASRRSRRRKRLLDLEAAASASPSISTILSTTPVTPRVSASFPAGTTAGGARRRRAAPAERRGGRDRRAGRRRAGRVGGGRVEEEVEVLLTLRGFPPRGMGVLRGRRVPGSARTTKNGRAAVGAPEWPRGSPPTTKTEVQVVKKQEEDQNRDCRADTRGEEGKEDRESAPRGCGADRARTPRKQLTTWDSARWVNSVE